MRCESGFHSARKVLPQSTQRAQSKLAQDQSSSVSSVLTVVRILYHKGRKGHRVGMLGISLALRTPCSLWFVMCTTEHAKGTG